MWAILHWNHLEKKNVYTQDSNNQSTAEDMHPSTQFLIVHKVSDAKVLVLTSISYPSACNPFARVNMYRECAAHARFGHTCQTTTEMIQLQTPKNTKITEPKCPSLMAQQQKLLEIWGVCNPKFHLHRLQSQKPKKNLTKELLMNEEFYWTKIHPPSRLEPEETTWHYGQLL